MSKKSAWKPRFAAKSSFLRMHWEMYSEEKVGLMQVASKCVGAVYVCGVWTVWCVNVCSVWTVWCAMHQCNASVRATEYKQLSWDHLSLSLKPQIKKSQNKELGYLKLKLIILCVCAGHTTFLNSRGKRLACQNKSHQGRPRSMNCDKFLAASSRGAPPPKMAFSHTSVGTFC